MLFKKTIAPIPLANSEIIKSTDKIDIKFNQINQSLINYIFKQKLWQVFLISILLIGMVIGLISTFNNLDISINKTFFSLLIFGLIILVVTFHSWLDGLKKQFEEIFLEEFSSTNNYSFDRNGSINEAYGSIFHIKGYRNRVFDVISGNYQSIPMQLFLYEVDIHGGSLRYSVMDIDLNGKLPNLLMINKKSPRNTRSILINSFDIKNTIQLEGNFNQQFTLFAPVGNEMEDLEIFSPDIMALMETESKHFAVELAGNHIYVYSDGFMSNNDDISRAFNLAKELIKKLAPVASQMKDDSAIIAPVGIAQSQKNQVAANLAKLVICSAIILLICLIGILSKK
jgi:hypothetical protein